MNAVQHDHAPEELCEAGLELYAQALRTGDVPSHEADTLPCLVDAGLLQPDSRDPGRLLPVLPAVAFPHLMRTLEEDIAHRRQQETRLAEVFASLLEFTAPGSNATDATGIRTLSGYERINVAIEEAMAKAQLELLAIQPYTGRNAKATTAALQRDQALLSRGGRIRTLYQHTLRHSPAIMARYEKLEGDAEARTLDQVTERLLVIDRKIAFIPANADRSQALEVRHPALLNHFITTFDRLWHLATPMYPRAVQPPSPDGITARQRAIAELLIEGHTDATIADRLGMNVRTARVHIAKLAATLGSQSRAQLGYLIGRSGILDQGR